MSTCIAKRDERGLSFVEVMVVMLLLGVIAVIGVAFANDWIHRESMRSASFTIQTHMQMARIEAVKRNRPCRFTIDSGTREINVWDLNDVSDTSDDILISTADVTDDVDFLLPVSGTPITLNNLSGDLYEATFDGGGIVTSGNGHIALNADDSYRKVTVYVAGGVHLEHWRDGQWGQGS